MKARIQGWFLAAVAVLVLLGMAARWLRPDRFRKPQAIAAVAAGGNAASVLEDAAVVARVDSAFEEAWRVAKVQPAAPADHLTLARRLSLALTGTIPSVEEIRQLERVPEADRLDWWVSYLLEDRRHADYLAERLARIVVGVEGGPFIVYRRHRLVTWLAEEIAKNRPYDALVRELMTAQGLWTSRPQVNFVTVTVDQNNDKEGPDEQKLAARVSRAFLGLRMDCVQCHDDFFGGRWKQQDFHQLAAFFACAEMSLTGVRDDEERRYEYRYLKRPEKERVGPRVPFNAGLLPVEGPTRDRLARWVTHPDNRPFARTLVNRTWALLFNRPLHKPIDDIPLDGPFPPGMEILADHAVATGYDLRRLIRVIVATRMFQAESRPGEPLPGVAAERASAPGTAGGGESLFAQFPLTRLRPDQVAGAILQSASLRTLDAETPVFLRVVRFFQQGDFVRRFGDIGEDEFDGFAGTIPQRLLLMNGEVVRDRTKDDVVMNAATRIGVVAPDDATAVETAYLAVLTRRPTAEESAHFSARLSEPVGNRGERMEDLYWALMNSTEFSWNH